VPVNELTARPPSKLSSPKIMECSQDFGTVPSSQSERGLWRLYDAVMTLLTASVLLLLIGMVVGSAVGYRFLVIESGSMVPTIAVGDLVVDREVSPQAVHRGDIVTFKDELIGDRLVTHRVVKMVYDGDVIHFTTKGDANKVPEHWTVPRSGTIGEEALVVPTGGLWLAYLTTTTAHLIAIWLLGFWLATIGLRWIWRKPAPPGTNSSEKRSTPERWVDYQAGPTSARSTVWIGDKQCLLVEPQAVLFGRPPFL
jgi:signal peptidase